MGGVFSGCVLPLKGLVNAPRASYHISNVSPLLPSPSHHHAFPHLVFLPLPPSLFIGVSFLRTGENITFFNGLDREDLSF